MLLFMNNGQAECVPELFVVFFESFSCNLKIVISGLGWLGSFQPFHMRFIQFFSLSVCPHCSHYKLSEAGAASYPCLRTAFIAAELC